MENLQNIIDENINSIIQISFGNLPVEDGWTKFDIDVVAVRTMITISAHYHTEDGKQVSFNPKYPSNNDRSTDLSLIFLDLREAMYKMNPDNGAWFECKIEVDCKGKFNTKFNYDVKPNFRYWPSKEKFVDDLNKFPRKQGSIPDWLKLAMEGKIK